MEGKQQAAGDLHFVGKKDELIEAKRSCRTIEGRDILIICHQRALYAMDSYCYLVLCRSLDDDWERFQLPVTLNRIHWVEKTNGQKNHYDAGGTLQNGDIEEINGKMCIICPKHKYKISLAEGEGLYKGADPTKKPPVPRWYSKGVKQRTHTVIETNGDVFVKLSETPGWIESDYYQGEKGKVERAKAEAAENDTSITENDE